MACSGIRVHKLGGSVLTDAAGIQQALQAVITVQAESALIVVSACSGVTDTLQGIAHRAAAGDAEGAQQALEELLARHTEYAHQLLPTSAWEEAERALQNLAAQAIQLCRGIVYLRELTPRTQDALLAFGELFASQLIADALRSLLSVPVLLADARRWVVTDATFGHARPQWEAVQQRVQTSELLRQLRHGAVVVTQGFIGATSEGVTTTLGRGGSDFSAALLAAAVGADELVIWKNVPGIFTADPRIVSEAQLVPVISAAEMRELALSGAKVLHPDTIEPAVAHGIGVRIRGVIQPEVDGTRIVAQRRSVAEPLALAWCMPCRVCRCPSVEALQQWQSSVFLGTFSRGGAFIVVPDSLDSIPEGCQAWGEPRVLLSVIGSAPERWALPMVERLLRAYLPCSGMWLGDSPYALRFLVPQEVWHAAVQELHAELLRYRDRQPVVWGAE